jgi:hypothetical protein
MPRGFDTPSDVTNAAGCLATAFGFIGRYYSDPRNAWKVVTPREANAISTAGLDLVAVYQNSNDTPSYFTQASGRRDGAQAYEYARVQMKQPPGTPVYFAVDYDASDQDIATVITDYFVGIEAAFRIAGGAYLVGAYGCGAACRAMHAATLAQFTWVASALKWNGTATFTGWNLKQELEEVVCGVRGDPNDATTSYGGFRVTSPDIA